jgi:hypothetical protein
MSQQYLRQLSLIVANSAGQGIELGALRVTFEVRRGDTQTPNTCDVKVWNLSIQTSNALRYRGASEFTQLSLKVAYQGQPLAQIFRGSIKQVRQGREDQRNSYIAITAADGDEAYNFAPAAFCLAKGNTAQNSVQAILSVMVNAILGSPTGGGGGQPITQGYSPTLNPNKSIRGRVFYGNCRDELREIADSQDCVWSIQDGQSTFIPKTGYIPSPPVLITPSTGLIGVPEQTQNGLEVRVLLNPSIKIGQTIKLDSTNINQLRYGLDTQSVANNLNLAEGAAKLNGDGLYYVLRANHAGDTRGTQWYTDLICLAVDATVPTPTSVEQAAIATADAIPQY